MEANSREPNNGYQIEKSLYDFPFNKTTHSCHCLVPAKNRYRETISRNPNNGYQIDKSLYAFPLNETIY